MTNTSHLVAITERLSREKARLEAATTSQERAFRAVQVSQAEKELAAEFAFLGMDATLPEISADDLMAELMA